MTTSTHTVYLDSVGPVDVTIDEYGEGQPFLLLHGGAGPQSVGGFGELLAATHDARAINPVHPGFGATPAPRNWSPSAGSLRCTWRCSTSLI